MELITLPLEEIKPYENNPRVNDIAVDAVAESIQQCGYVQPIVVDENHVILAGHTRYKALKKLGYTECRVAVEGGLSEEKKRKYRLLDNKTGEFATWDFSKLEKELEEIDFEGFDFGFDPAQNTDVDSFFEDEQPTDDQPQEEPQEEAEQPQQVVIEVYPADSYQCEEIMAVLTEHEYKFKVR